MTIVKIVKTISPTGEVCSVRGYIEREFRLRPAKMSEVKSLLAEEGWKKFETTHVEEEAHWLPKKEITTIAMHRLSDLASTEGLLRKWGVIA